MSSRVELEATAKQNAVNARHANPLVVNVTSIPVIGGLIVSDVVQNWPSISTSSKKIVNIFTAIEDITFQPKIEVFNVVIEAAWGSEQAPKLTYIVGAFKPASGSSGNVRARH
jgi:methyl-accepting chemotaxis protein